MNTSTQTFTMVFLISFDSLLDQSLNNLDQQVQAFDEQISQLDLQIKECIREQAYASESARDELKKINEESAHLIDKIHSVKQKAEISEEMVKSICSEIRSLDFAKKNITFTITSLKRLIMLSNRFPIMKITSLYSNWNRVTERLLYKQAVRMKLAD